jgi:hypothetical protein
LENIKVDNVRRHSRKPSQMPVANSWRCPWWLGYDREDDVHAYIDLTGLALQWLHWGPFSILLSTSDVYPSLPIVVWYLFILFSFASIVLRHHRQCTRGVWSLTRP